MRRLLILASVLVFVDVAFYAAIAPILPDYVDRFDLSEGAAGILQASYGAGTMLVALPAGFLAARIGARPTVLAGLALFGLSGAAFGFASSIVLLDVTRFLQGVGGGMVWSAALAWLIAAFPPERRGAAIGVALGTAMAGALVGPLLGGIAAEVGTEPVFGSILVVAIGLGIVAIGTPEPPMPPGAGRWPAGVARRPLLMATVFVAVPSLMFGAIEVLVPLQIDDLGGGHVLIAVAFAAAAATEGAIAPLAGRYSDRAGRRRPYLLGAVAAAAAMVALALAGALGVVVAALLVGAVGAGFCFAPAMTALTEVAERTRLHHGIAAGLSNMAWAAGQMLGALCGGLLAGVGGYALPNLTIAAMILITALAARRSLGGGGGYPPGQVRRSEGEPAGVA